MFNVGKLVGIFKTVTRIIYALILSITVALPVWSLEQVTLQLKWQHQFQFAGYYAAISQGYYRELGLDVSLREAKPLEDPVQYVLEGNTQFGVGTSELILLHHFNQPVVVLAVIFQHSPLALIVPKTGSKQGEPLSYQYIQDLIEKPVMMEANSAELLAYLASEGLTRKKLKLVDHTFEIKDMLNGKAAAMSGYITDEPFLLQQLNIDYQLFKPIMGGIDFYGDNLFTTQAMLDSKPKQVEAFRNASLRGWEYAMEHPEEIIDLILTKYSQRHTREHLVFEAEQMKELIRPDLIEVGYMYEGRWRHIGQTYAEQNMLPNDYKLDGFLYEPSKAKFAYRFKDGVTIAAIFVVLIFSVLGVFCYFNRQLRKKTKWLNTVFSSAPSALMILDGNGKIVRWNRQATTIFGWAHDEVKGKTIYEFLIPLPNQSKLREALKRTLDEENSASEHYWCHTQKGKMILCDWKNAFLQSDRLIAMVRDITQQKELEDKLNQMAHSDALTGIANRTWFFQKLEEAISLAKRRKEKVALLFIDLDDFKIVNDQYGHEFGDVVLCEVVQRIKMAVREADTLARIGGDEFVLILHDCETNERALQVAEKVLFHLERPMQVSGLTVIVGGSIGISFYPDDGKKTAELLKSADRAMYEVKQNQKNGIGLASNSHYRH
jgi:diguanylate cyclase (GGDEF)-like protein/PAS domain S-box-containing protein